MSVTDFKKQKQQKEDLHTAPAEVFTQEMAVLTFKSEPLAFFIDSAFPK